MFRILLIRIVGVFIVLGGFGYYLTQLSSLSGGAPIKAPSFALPDLPSFTLPSFARPAFLKSDDHVTPETNKTIYSWRDEKGVLHFSGEAPRNQQADRYIPSTPINRIPPVDVPDSSATGDQLSRPADGTPGAPLIEQALEARRQLEARQNQQKQVLDRL